MKTKLIILLLLLFLVGNFGCKKDKETTILLTVYANPTYSVQPSEKPGEFDVSSFMIVMENDSNVEQQLALDAIDGFIYERGFEYLLKVKKEGDNTRYLLIELVSKTKVNDEKSIVLLHVSSDTNLIGLDVSVHSNPPLVFVKEEGSDWWQLTSFKLEGFEYENGFDFLLKVHKTSIQMPVITGIPSYNIYSLIEIISKTPKTN